MLEELQEVLADVREAREQLDAVLDAKAGDDVYDDIWAEAQSSDDPEATCQEQLKELVRQIPCCSAGPRILTRGACIAGAPVE